MPRKLSLQSLQASIRRLSDPEVGTLLEWLSQYQQQRSQQQSSAAVSAPDVSAPYALERRQLGASTFLVQGVKCNKIDCKCSACELHVPYWYEYIRVDGVLKKKYHGKTRGPSKFAPG